MNDQEQRILQALRRMLDPIEPPSSLPPRTLRRARVRRAFNAAVSGSIALLVLAGISGGAISISNDGGDTPRPPAIHLHSRDPALASISRETVNCGGSIWKAT
jgi:hypothetical protein